MNDDHNVELPQSHETQLFMVRLWHGDGVRGAEIRGRVQHVLSGEVIYFRDWATLATFMTAQLGPLDDDRDRG